VTITPLLVRSGRQKEKMALWKLWDCCGTTQVLMRELHPHDNEEIVMEILDQEGNESESRDDNEDGD